MPTSLRATSPSGSNEGAPPRCPVDSPRVLRAADGGVLHAPARGSEQHPDRPQVGADGRGLVPSPRTRSDRLGNRLAAGADGGLREPSSRGARAWRRVARRPRYVARTRLARASRPSRRARRLSDHACERQGEAGLGCRPRRGAGTRHAGAGAHERIQSRRRDCAGHGAGRGHRRHASSGHRRLGRRPRPARALAPSGEP